MLKLVFCDPNLFYRNSVAPDKRVVYMDPAIGWFQPEQYGPALSLWNEIWSTHQRLDSHESYSKSEVKTGESMVMNGNCSVALDDRKAAGKKSDSNSTSDNAFSNRIKRKENKASTYGLSRNFDLISHGGTPWRPKEKLYRTGLFGLHQEIEDFYNYMSPTPTEHRIRLEVVERITKIIQKLWPQAKPFLDRHVIEKIPRSREVGQSWITSIFTTIHASIISLVIVFKHKPDAILCNGPGTCVPICLSAFLLHVLGIKHIIVIYVESICRVKTMSLSGKILYYVADYLLVQWPQIREKYPKAKYLGMLI